MSSGDKRIRSTSEMTGSLLSELRIIISSKIHKQDKDASTALLSLYLGVVFQQSSLRRNLFKSHYESAFVALLASTQCK